MISIDNPIISESSHSYPRRPSLTYRVFLSFRGEDTRYGFTGHLYEALGSYGILTFSDDVEIESGGDIASELKDAIEASEIFVIIFSENYARSRWCLDELAIIYECKARNQPPILPIFYRVDPSEVRHQTGRYGEALAEHEKDEANPEKKAKIKKWRAALTEAGNTSGYHLQPNGSEALLVKKIVSDIHKRLNCKRLHMGENIVGMNFHLNKIKSLIDVELSTVRVIGICGIGGIGKTTIAKAIYNSIFYQFDGSSFLENVGGTRKCSGLLELQQKLLHDILKGRDLNFRSIDEGINVIKERLHSKRVLIVVDNVDDLCQLKYLIGKRDWFCGGSRIIITTRDKHLLDVHGVDELYEPQELIHDESVVLFCQHAFKQSLPRDDYKNIMNRAVNYAKGHPLALKVLGDHLFNKTIPEWESSLCKLERELLPEIRSVLQMSFDGLDDTEKEIFLDIACFFKGKDKDFVVRILDGCKFYGVSGIRVLADKSLLIVSDKKLDMHDLLQHMGWDIVRGQCLREPGRWSRLWAHEDVYPVLKKNTGTKAIEGIILDMSKSKQIQLTTKAFRRMTRLRVFEVHQDAEYCKWHPLPGDFTFPSDDLVYLHWNGYPLNSLPSTFHAENLVELNLQSSGLETLWDKELVLVQLKVLNVSYSQRLIQFPDFSSLPNLEILSIKGCGNLGYLPSGIHNLKHLKSLCCSGCSKMEILPEIEEDMENLRELYLDGTGIFCLPSSIERLVGVEYLDLGHCKNLESLPTTICNLRSLKKLIASHCPTLRILPSIYTSLQDPTVELVASSYSDESFDVGSTFEWLLDSPVFSKFEDLFDHHGTLKASSPQLGSQPSESPKPKNPHMETIHTFGEDRILILINSCLEELDLSYCNLMGGGITPIYSYPPSLLALNLSGNPFLSTPLKNINKFYKLRILKMSHIQLLQKIPEIPLNLREIDAHGCPSLLPLQKQTQLPHFVLPTASNHIFRIVNSGLYGSSNRFIPGSQYGGEGISVLLDGSVGVPKWIKHQSMGNEVAMEVPLNWYEDDNLLGFSFFSFHVPVNGSKGEAEGEDQSPCCSSTLKCELSFHGEQSGIVDDLFWDSSCGCYENGDASDQVWVTYYPMVAVKEMYHSNSYRFLKASFHGRSMKVEKCGMDLIYAKRRTDHWTVLGNLSVEKGSTSERAFIMPREELTKQNRSH